MSEHLGDTNKMVSDTPRMKAAQMAAMENMTADVWRVGFDLELELNDMKQLAKLRLDIIRQLEAEKVEANDRIKRLEDAGDALYEHCNPSRWDSPTDAARKMIDQSNWNKAKEAK